MADFAAHVRAHGPWVRLADDLWQITGDGPPLDRNMVAWRRPDGGVWLHSVVALDEARMAELDGFGRVDTIVVPNGFHRRDAAVWAARYPSAKVLAPAAARDRVAQVVRVDATCEETAEGLGLRVHVPRGTKPGELAYELPIAGGRALVVADLLFNLLARPPGVRGFVLKHVTDSLGPLKTSRVFRLLVLRDAATYAGWVEEIAGIAELRVLTVGHGDAVTADVSGALNAAAARIRG